MEIENEGQQIASNRIMRKLILPSLAQVVNSNEKNPAITARTIKIGEFTFSFKVYLVGAKSFSYRCENRTICKCLVHIPLESSSSSSDAFP